MVCFHKVRLFFIIAATLRATIEKCSCTRCNSPIAGNIARNVALCVRALKHLSPVLMYLACVSCRSMNLPIQPVVIFANTVDIRRINLDGTGYGYVVRGLSNVVGLDFDIKTKTIYWSDVSTKKIQRVVIDQGLDPRNVEDFITTDLGLPEDLALDWIHRKLYWSDAGRATINVIRLDGTDRRALIAIPEERPRGLVVDPADNRLYWADWGDDAKISRALLDGTSKEILVSLNVVWPNGLAIDYKDKTLFWADANTGRLEKSSLNGKNRQVLIDSIDHPYSVTQFRDRVYWTGRHTIEHCDKKTGLDRVTLSGSMARPSALHVYHPDRQPGADANECLGNISGCSHTCLDMIGGYRCLCPQGLELANDQKTCKDIDECSYNRGGCWQLCVNYIGSYNCSCLDGYNLLTDGQSCQDEDECSVNNGGCEFQCVNTKSSYLCSCPSGYSLATDKHKCVDVNECVNNNHSCPESCVNTAGSYECTCSSGLSYDLVQNTCNDMNECTSSRNTCQQQCVNTRAAFHCACSTGYLLLSDGVSCADIDECNESRHSCQHQCVNTEGSYTCSCTTGHALALDTRTCLEVDCGNPASIQGIRVTCDGTADEHHYEKNCTLTCTTGFLLGTSTITCQSSAAWTVIRARCVLQIPDLSSPPTGIILSSNSVAENSAVNDVIGKLTTIDSNEAFTYTMVEGGTGSIGLDNSRRALVVNGYLDFETQSRYEIRVKSTGSGTMSGTPMSYIQNLTIHVLDVNEPPSQPTLLRSVIPENVSIGSVVGMINCSDVDAGNHVTLSLLINGRGLFSIHGNTLYVNGPLDFERQSSYVVTIQARDDGFPSLTEVSTLNVTVLDSNDPPKKVLFHGGAIAEYVNDPKGTQNGSFVGNLSTVDDDIGDVHSYEIIDAVSCPFIVIGSSLVTSLARALDYESRDHIRLTIRATDQGGAAITTDVVVKLKDINERPTAILLSANTFTEHAPIGTVIGTLSARDTDRLGNHSFMLGNHSFMLRSGAGGAFTVNGNQLTLVKHIYFEAVANPLSIRVRVTDYGGLTFEQDFNITVLNKNDPPQAIALKTYTSCSPGVAICVPENKPVNYPIAEISVQDPDHDDAITCAVVRGHVFGVRNRDLVVNSSINYETLGPTHVVMVMLRCSDAGGLGVEQTFSVTITDSNDPPTRVRLSHQLVRSDAPRGSLVGTLIVDDEDEGDFHKHRCILLSNENLFRIHGLELRTRAILTNATETRHLVRVWCYDFRSAAFPHNLYVEVQNIHMFAQMNITLDSTTIAENKLAGSLVGHVFAKSHDPTETFSFLLDVDDNGAFTLVNGSAVGSCNLATTSRLDYEKHPSYMIVIRAYGSRGRTHFEVFTIRVLDILEPIPYVVLYPHSVSENTANVLVGIVTLETPYNHQLSIISDPSDAFQLQWSVYSWQLMTKRSLDFETALSHQITVNIRDTTTLFSVNQTFVIDVTNVNEAPTAIHINGSHVMENSASLVGYFTVIDPDEPQEAQTFSCRLRNDADGCFMTSNLQLLVGDSQLLDYESPKGTKYLIDVECQDQDGESIQQKFVIDIDDVNERPTAINSLSGKFEVFENLSPGHVVATLHALDQDKDDLFTYKISDANSSLVPFTVQGNQLITTQSLDFESRDKYAINVTCMDSGHLSITQLIHVTVLNTNEPPTNIVLAGGVSVTENAKIGTLVSELYTVDEDRGQTHTYTIHSQTPRGVLGIRDTNKLYIAQNSHLNYETLQSVHITIATKDSGMLTQLSKVVTMVIPITDTNEPPHDIEISRHVVLEHCAMGTVVGSITVEDPDSFPQSFTCLLVDDAGGRFVITQNGSQIDLLTSHNRIALNYEAAAQHHISVKCSDGGGYWYHKQFTIRVLDVNDKPSNIIFTDSLGDTTLNPHPLNTTNDVPLASTPVVTVNETARLGVTIVTYVTVIDEDNQNKPQLQTHACTLISEDEAFTAHVPLLGNISSRPKRSTEVPAEFMVQPGTNSILVRQSLNYERRSLFTLFLRCTDSGVPGLSVIASLQVQVLDVHEPPTDILMTSLTVAENSPEGTLLGKLSVTDPDLTNTVYSYQLESRGVPFCVEGNQVIVSRTPLDHERTPSMTIQITVRETSTLLYFTKNFHVNITDMNEAPSRVTLNGLTQVTIAETSPIGDLVGDFIVEDQDAQDTAFNITIDGINSSDFYVREGRLYVASQLNAWMINRYSLYTRAVDRGGLDTSNIITVVVQEVNMCAINRTDCSPYATCSRAGPGKAKCVCKLGFHGDGQSCVDIDDCEPNPCHPTNTISSCRDGFGGYKNYSCPCKEGWSAPNCDVVLNTCQTRPCSAHGTKSCEPLWNGYRCHCKPGFTGRVCETNTKLCSKKSCLNDGTCVTKGEGFVCICKDSFIGVDCDTDDTFCQENSSICPRNGTCISYPEKKSKYLCSCDPPWGRDCVGCAPGYGGPECRQCQYPWTGENCQQDWRNCELDSCHNGGTCYPLEGNGFACVCSVNYTGTYCHIDLTQLQSPLVTITNSCSPLLTYSVISVSCVVLLFIAFIVVWRWTRCRKAKQYQKKVKTSPSSTTEVSGPKMNNTCGCASFSKPYPSTMPSHQIRVNLEPANYQQPPDDSHRTMTICNTSSNPKTKMFDNPLYESVQDDLHHQQRSLQSLCACALMNETKVSGGHDSLVQNPIFISENPCDTGKRIWREDGFSVC